MEDPREGFLSKINLPDVSIDRFPKIIFFCGGPYRAETPYLSARHYIVTAIQASPSLGLRVKNAEEIKEWNHYDIYPDLLGFEEDIAHICKLVVLFVESPGSLAELGFFAVTEEIARKLLVFLPRHYSGDSSFINLGPIKYLKSRERESVLKHVFIYDFLNDEGKFDQLKTETYRSVIVEDIVNQSQKKTRHQLTGEKLSKAFVFLLICDIIYLFKALKLTEIVEYLERLDIDGWPQKKVSQALFCLEKLDLILVEELSSGTYYMPREIDGLFLSYGEVMGRIDTARLSMKVAQYYAENDKRRSLVVARIGEFE